MTNTTKKVDNLLGTYREGTLSDCIRAYAFERMQRDRVYRNGVHASRKAKKLRHNNNRPQN